MKFSKLFLCLILSLACVSAQEVAEAETTTEPAEGAASTTENDETTTAATESSPEASATTDEAEEIASSTPQKDEEVTKELPVQSGPFVDLFGPSLLSLEMTSPTTAQLNEMLTNDALKGKKVIGLYFSADWVSD